MTGLRIVAAAHTPALRRAVFGGDDGLDEGGRNAALALRPQLSSDTAWVCSPSRAAGQTAEMLGAATFTVAAELADIDYGAWTGRGLHEVELGDWLTSPDASPHGGESLTGVTERAGRWLDRQAGIATTAVAHPAVVRAVVAYALNLPPDGIWRLDVAPLSITRLTHRAGRWHLAIR
ncbi:histidine phosphatase family protein [Actinoplanes solisilvae]|uniref:histidine phosphatase family protein n=1 Tax=Actinoplanes solisilvae TaxID=2486853 RepID=UPI0013E30519|nr:histidine phosphatase family protein [Actinoplanes solisilvae]